MLPPHMKYKKVRETSIIFRRSLIYQTKEFFQNSTLHGIKYIAESERPIGQRFMWFCFTSIAAVAALIIIMSLWEKFQTNPTITGVDTDFYNQVVIFPTVIVCPDAPYDSEKVFDWALKILDKTSDKADPEHVNRTAQFLAKLTTLNYDFMNELIELSQAIPTLEAVQQKNLRQLAFDVKQECEHFLSKCIFHSESFPCCSRFVTVYTEHGICFAFNSRIKSLPAADIDITFQQNELYESDINWGLHFTPASASQIIVMSDEEYPCMDFFAQLDWQTGQKTEARVAKKNTFTTEDARQLTISQRKCIFKDEVKLQYFPNEYTFSNCEKECRLNKALKFCHCSPPFYTPLPNIKNCTLKDFPCLFKYKSNITTFRDCLQCQLGCTNTVYNIEKLVKEYDQDENQGVLIEFLVWPIIRYKREVLFGWIDLMVSFGGIASLFLGFSLLSGVEIVYYFTLRACCMVYKNRQELYEIEENIRKRPPSHIDLTLKPKTHITRSLCISSKINDSGNDNDNLLVSGNRNSYDGNGAKGGRRRKTDKDYVAYSRSLYRSPRVITKFPEAMQTGQYLP